MGAAASFFGDDLYHPKGMVKAVEWPIHCDDFIFPELRNDQDGVKSLRCKPSFAVCLSGGGYRAAVCSLGWVRMLRELGFLAKARYLNSNSGGSWFNTVFSYQQKYPTDVFLGPYIPPQKLTLKKATTHEKGSFGEVLMSHDLQRKSFLARLVQGQIDEILVGDWKHPETVHRRLNAWSETVGETFFREYGLDRHRSSFGLAGPSACRAAEACKGLPVFTACRCREMPFPIVVASVAPAGDPLFFHPFEYTPLYSGVPVREIEATHYEHALRLGGHLVDSYALCAEGPCRRRCKGKRRPRREIKVRPFWVPPVVQVAGFSSALRAPSTSRSQSALKVCGEGAQAVAQVKDAADGEKLWEAQGNPELFYWDGVDGKTTKVGMADGGGLDNLAILPALRRGVRSLLILCANEHPAGEDGAGGRLWEDDAWDVAGYFGRVREEARPSGKQIDQAKYNAHVQVFRRKAFDALKAQALELSRGGGPVAVRMQLDVLKNRGQGVRGGYVADTLWVFNGGRGAWAAGLPEESRVQLALDVKRTRLPYISTLRFSYSATQVSFLSQLASWTIRQMKDDIDELIASAEQPCQSCRCHEDPEDPQGEAPPQPAASAPATLSDEESAQN